MKRSPMVLLVAVLALAATEASAQQQGRCRFNGNNYDVGSTACVNGERWICLQTGRWETTKERCYKDDENLSPTDTVSPVAAVLDRFPTLRHQAAVTSRPRY